jgi:hypothetical protein
MMMLLWHSLLGTIQQRTSASEKDGDVDDCGHDQLAKNTLDLQRK